LNGISLNELGNHEQISLNSIHIYNPDIEIYRDKRLPDAPFKKKPLITGLILKIPIPVGIDSLLVIDGKLVYEELLDLSDIPGKIYFDPLYLTATNITNRPGRIKKDPIMPFELNGMLMGTSEINSQLKFHLNRQDEYFSAKGKLAKMDGTALNEMFKSLLMAEIKEWDVHSAEFEFTATDDNSHGTLDLAYENLKIEVLKVKKPEKKATFYTLLAGGVIKHKNLPENPNFRRGIIRFERRKDKAIVNFLWNSVKTGIISTIAPIADKNRKIEKQEQKEAEKKEKEKKKSNRKSKKSGN
jgi:hypothetical protein